MATNNVIVADCIDIRLRSIAKIGYRYQCAIITLVLDDEEELKRRIRYKTCSSGYKYFESAIRHNPMI